MPIRYDIVHTTVYRYRTPVTFGEHRVMFRPRDSHDLRVLATDLQVSPEAIVRMIQDPHSNSVALVQPIRPATELRLVCSFTIERADVTQDLSLLSPSAEHLPFAYSVQDRFDLEHYLRPHHDDPEGKLIAWAHQFFRHDGPTGTRDLLERMNQHINQNFRYETRDEEGTQTPLQTLALSSGSCRDYALLMMEAARRLGVATRFVSGYLYDAALDDNTVVGSGDAITGAGATHAWLQAYLPGAGWVAYDPTNNLLGGSQLIRVAVARDPAFAAPVSGSWFGERDAYESLEATVQVKRRAG
ncbi:transglutaminase family protein [Variovorax arabinosiphilus]|uniref:transglutaminase family protein n=1 Tax=Variovorax arabinosiphilus TaxID=3053498 RepID=UPI0025771BFF|nr:MULTISPECIES: transglutaminase family protein [unclassified Variovorax]MDM0118452.1 transglutaminase family protein [Variovorax sp. J2L1-78]MDM0128877.1 transglutaminase family protein [Variovorax sp. J2L1-63]MDM0233337.1 transglutaminase family protein [Variovorax sp. J2R1-6]